MSLLRADYAAACAEWGERVRADGAQVNRVREVADGDFYGPIAQAFKADPRRTNEPVLNELLKLVRHDETWLDIGAGGGRYTLPIALAAKQVTAVEPSDGMIGVLREGLDEHGISNVRVVQSRWPNAEVAVRADCSLISMVGNDVAEIGPFLDAMEAATERLCVLVNLDRPPPSAFFPAFKHVHGEERAALPSIPEFLALLLAKRRLFEVQLVPRQPMSFESPDQVIAMARRQTWVKEGGAKDVRLQAFIRESLVEQDGRFALSFDAGHIAIVTWAPR
ncbi:MAG: class I SAM-dependent methyltransferase [Dehalococcoidia bacterium]